MKQEHILRLLLAFLRPMCLYTAFGTVVNFAEQNAVLGVMWLVLLCVGCFLSEKIQHDLKSYQGK